MSKIFFASFRGLTVQIASASTVTDAKQYGNQIAVPLGLYTHARSYVIFFAISNAEIPPPRLLLGIV